MPYNRSKRDRSRSRGSARSNGSKRGAGGSSSRRDESPLDRKHSSSGGAGGFSGGRRGDGDLLRRDSRGGGSFSRGGRNESNSRGGGRGGSRNLSRQDSRRGQNSDRRTRSRSAGSDRDGRQPKSPRGRGGGGDSSARKSRGGGKNHSSRRSHSSRRRSITASRSDRGKSDSGDESAGSDDDSSSSERDEALMYPKIEPNAFLQGKRYRVVRELGKGICARVVHAVEGVVMEPMKVVQAKGKERAFQGQRDVALKVFRATSVYSRAAFEEYSYLVDLMSRNQRTERGAGADGGDLQTTFCDLSIAEEKHFLAPIRFHFAEEQQGVVQQKRPAIPPELRGKKNKDRRRRWFKQQAGGAQEAQQPTGKTSAIITFPLCGPSLFSMLEQRRMVGFPLHAVRNILFQLFTCLDHCVAKGVMHTDVKPENILLTCRTKKTVRCDKTLVENSRPSGGPADIGPVIEEPQHWGIVLSDFGNALHPVQNPDKETVIQTRQYRAPEIILKCGYHFPASDVWSVGCMIPELLTGQCLWLAKDHMEQLALMEQVLSPISEKTLQYLFSTSLTYPGKYSYGAQEVAGKYDIKNPLTEAHRYYLEDPTRKRGYQLRWPDKDTKTKDLTYVNGADTIETIVSKVVLGRAGDNKMHNNQGGAGAGARKPGNSNTAGSSAASPQLKETAKNLEDLIFKCLTYNPTKRITPAEALKHPFFTEASF